MENSDNGKNASFGVSQVELNKKGLKMQGLWLDIKGVLTGLPHVWWALSDRTLRCRLERFGADVA